MPCWMASSKLLSESALISVTVATLISSVESPLFGCSLTTTSYMFAYHLKGEAKHIGDRPLNNASTGAHSPTPIGPSPRWRSWPYRRALSVVYAHTKGRDGGLRASGRGKAKAAPQ